MRPQLSWLISLPHALKIVKKLGQKRHRDAGYSVELEDLGKKAVPWNQRDRFYAEYTSGTSIYRLNIFYSKPDKVPARAAVKRPRKAKEST